MRFFRYDSAFWTVTEKIFDLMLLNILWFLTSIPIVTIGAASTALSSVTMQMSRGEDVPILKGYFSAFRQKWKSATAVWMIALASICWLFFGLYVCADLRNPVLRLTVMPEAAMLMICILGTIYLFPVCAEQQGSIRKTIQTALYLSLKKLPWSFVLALLLVLPVCVTIFFQAAFPLMLMFWIFLGVGSISYGMAFIFKRIFNQERGDYGEALCGR